MKIAAVMNDRDEGVRAARLLQELWGNLQNPEILARLLAQLRRVGDLTEALDLSTSSFDEFADNAAVQVEVARLVSRLGDETVANEFIERGLDPRIVLRTDPSAAIELLRLGGREEEVDANIDEAVRALGRRGATPELVELGRDLVQSGRSEVFEQALRKYMEPDEVERTIEYLSTAGFRRRTEYH